MMTAKVFKVDTQRPQVKIIKAAAEAVKKGRLVIFPTETVYGIAAARDNPEALERLRAIKKRPKDKPFTLHIYSIRQLEDFDCRPDNKTMAFLKRCWPGPFTVILKTARGERIGFRIPDNKIALGLLKYAQIPIVAPSANVSGEKAPASIKEISANIKNKVDLILDGGRTELGVSSKIIDFTEAKPEILRR